MQKRKEILISTNWDLRWNLLFSLLMNYTSENEDYKIKAYYNYPSVEVYYYDEKKKKLYFDSSNPNKYSFIDLLEQSNFYIANTEQKAEYKKELIDEQINVVSNLGFQFIELPYFEESKDIYAQSFIDGYIQTTIKIDTKSFWEYLERSKKEIITFIEWTDFSSKKLTEYIYQLLVSIKEKKGKIKIYFDKLETKEIEKDIFLQWILLLAIYKRLSIIHYEEYLEVEIIEVGKIENNDIEDPESEIKELYSTLYSMINNNQYREIILKKDNDWIADTIEAKKHLQRDGNTFVDLQKQHPFADIQAKVHKWRIQKYSVLEKIRLDKTKQ